MYRTLLRLLEVTEIKCHVYLKWTVQQGKAMPTQSGFVGGFVDGFRSLSRPLWLVSGAFDAVVGGACAAAFFSAGGLNCGPGLTGVLTVGAAVLFSTIPGALDNIRRLMDRTRLWKGFEKAIVL